ncbi:MAG: RluA family pseudouridine synthase, partial [Deltaproteobacteria bacterium]
MRQRFVCRAADRLDRAIAAHTPLSRKRARSLVERGGVRVDGAPARFASQRVEAGAVIEVRSATPARDKVPELPERYRDRDVVVVDKPSGLPSQGTREGGRVHVHGILQAREAYVGLHHRLDRPASGLMLLTLRRPANRAIAEALRRGEITREYLAVVLGDPGPAGTWTDDVAGRPARTRWQRLATRGGVAVLLCTLDTGRTHQIRQHAAAAGHPILGDRRYGGAAGRA